MRSSRDDASLERELHSASSSSAISSIERRIALPFTVGGNRPIAKRSEISAKVFRRRTESASSVRSIFSCVRDIVFMVCSTTLHGSLENQALKKNQ